jgi:Ca-activated chloride channel family protein
MSGREAPKGAVRPVYVAAFVLGGAGLVGLVAVLGLTAGGDDEWAVARSPAEDGWAEAPVLEAPVPAAPAETALAEPGAEEEAYRGEGDVGGLAAPAALPSMPAVRGGGGMPGLLPSRPASPRHPTPTVAQPQPLQNAPARGPARQRAAGEVVDPWGAPAAAPVLPQNAVLASNFVGGRGAAARLEDLLDRGVMVDGENIRLEAFDELGRLPYAVPSTEAVALYAELERERLVTNGERVHLQIALMARQGEAPARPRMDVRLVLDRSGSMSGEKWTNAIAAAHALVDRLQAGDTFGLISYSDDATLDLSPARVGNRRAAHAAIDRLVTGGGTNIESGLRLADRHAPSRSAMNDVLLTVFVSDGIANIGQTNATELGAIARGSFDREGVLTTSIGLGTDFDESTMLSIAREGSGSYHFVRRAADIEGVLRDELEERAQAVAQALRVRVELAEGVVATRVYGSRVLTENEAAAVRRTEIATDRRLARELGIARDRQNDEERGLRLHVPTFRRGDQHVILMELSVPAGRSASEIAHVTLDYKDLVALRNRTTDTRVNAERTSDREAAVASTQRTVKRTVLAFSAGDALSTAARALQSGDLAGARTALAERRELLVAASDLWNDRDLERDAQLLARYERVLGSAWPSWDDGSRNTMVMAMNFYGDQRMQ